MFSSTVLLPSVPANADGLHGGDRRHGALGRGHSSGISSALVGRLTGRFQARYLLGFGWIALAMGMYLSCKHLDLLISFRVATVMRILQCLPVGFLLVPLTMAAYVGLWRKKPTLPPA